MRATLMAFLIAVLFCGQAAAQRPITTRGDVLAALKAEGVSLEIDDSTGSEWIFGMIGDNGFGVELGPCRPACERVTLKLGNSPDPLPSASNIAEWNAIHPYARATTNDTGLDIDMVIPLGNQGMTRDVFASYITLWKDLLRNSTDFVLSRGMWELPFASAPPAADSAPVRDRRTPQAASVTPETTPLPDAGHPIVFEFPGATAGSIVTALSVDLSPCDGPPSEGGLLVVNADGRSTSNAGFISQCMPGQRIRFIYFDVPHLELRRKFESGFLEGFLRKNALDYRTFRWVRLPNFEVWEALLARVPRPAPKPRIVARAPAPIPPTPRPAIPGAPGETDILGAHARAFARNYAAQTTGTPGQLAYPSPFGGVAYYEQRILSGLSCRKLPPGTYRCSYSIAKTYQAAPDSYYGKFLVGFKSNTSPAPFTYDYQRRNGRWESSALDAEVRRAAAAASATNAERDRADSDAARRRSEENERQRKEDWERCKRNAPAWVACPY